MWGSILLDVGFPRVFLPVTSVIAIELGAKIEMLVTPYNACMQNRVPHLPFE